ncbi:MAG: cobalamin-dependent protein [Pseudomonadota bacterium]
MDILYLHPFPRGERQARGAAPVGLSTYPVVPMGAVGLCNLLRSRGREVTGLNLAVERMLDPAFRPEAWLAARQPAAEVLIDLHWHEHSLGALQTAEAVRAAWPGARILLGGLTATIHAEEILTACPAVDGVVLGDGEGGFITGAPNLRTRAGGPTVPPWHADSATLSALDTVDLAFLAHAEDYRRLLYSHPRRPGPPPTGRRGHWLCNGRGCAHDCALCGGGRAVHRAVFGRPGITWRTSAAIARDLARLAALGVEQVALGLDPELAGPAHLETWLAELPRIGLYLESFRLPSTELLDTLARRARLEDTELALSAWSGDERLRRRLGPGFDDAALLATVVALQAREISASVFFALGLPGASEATLARTLDLAHRLLDADRQGLLRLAATPVALDPLAPMARTPGAWGMERTHPGDLTARLARGRALAEGRIAPHSPEALGYRVPGLDLEAHIARWNALAEERPDAVIPAAP